MFLKRMWRGRLDSQSLLSCFVCTYKDKVSEGRNHFLKVLFRFHNMLRFSVKDSYYTARCYALRAAWHLTVGNCIYMHLWWNVEECNIEYVLLWGWPCTTLLTRSLQVLIVRENEIVPNNTYFFLFPLTFPSVPSSPHPCNKRWKKHDVCNAQRSVALLFTMV